MLALVLLSACSAVPPVLSVLTTALQMDRPEERPPLPNPRPIEQRELRWKVLTPETLPKNDDWVYFGITPRDYEDLSLNQAEVLRFVREVMWRLRYYRNELPPDAAPPDKTEDR